VALRETLAGPSQADYLYQPPPDPTQKIPERKARVRLSVRPLGRGREVELTLNPRVLPEPAQLTPEQAAALKLGVRYALSSGPLEGAPLVDLALEVDEVEVYGAATSPEAVQAAASQATRRALMDAGGLLLRPIMSVEVVVPQDNLGTVLGDLQSRQALIRDTQSQGNTSSIDCEVALDRLLGYATELRSMTQGRGQFSMQFMRFDAA
jgi:elongation factor G